MIAAIGTALIYIIGGALVLVILGLAAIGLLLITNFRG